jgi:hypothetical protein
MGKQPPGCLELMCPGDIAGEQEFAGQLLLTSSHSVVRSSTFLVVLVLLGFELRVLNLLGRRSTTGAHTSGPFCFGYSGDRVSLFCPGWPGP